MFVKEEVNYLDMTFEQASKFIVSAGEALTQQVNYLFRELFQPLSTYNLSKFSYFSEICRFNLLIIFSAKKNKSL